MDSADFDAEAKFITDDVTNAPSDQFSSDEPFNENHAPLRKRRPPGPGLPESLGWIVLFFGLQVASLVAVFTVMLIFGSNIVQQGQKFDFQAWMTNLDPISKTNIIGLPVLLSFALLTPLGLWRMSPAPLRKLKIGLPSVGQTLIAVSMLFPVIIVSDWAFRLVSELLRETGILESMEDLFVQNQLRELNEAPILLLILYIAATPALGEEFLFRGLIGRGLTARWGWITGIGLTSLLFGAVHLYPPHIAAAMVLGIAMHILYLTTKSIWAPVLFHFLNNSLSVVMMRVSGEDVSEPNQYLTIGAMFYFGWCIYWLYQMRTIDQPVTTEEVTTDASGVITDVSGVAGQIAPELVRKSTTYALPCIAAVIALGLGLFAIASDLLQ